MHVPGRSLALATLLTGAATASPAQRVERHVLAGLEVAVYNLAGEVRLEPGPGPDVVVEVTRGGADAARLEIGVGSVQGRAALRIHYPEDRVVYRQLGRGSSATVSVAADGTFGWSRHGGRRIRISGRGDGLEAHADLRVLVPAGKRIRVAHGVGRTTVRDVSGDLAVSVASADIDASGTKGSLSLDTGSGSVTVSGAEGDLQVDTGSGNVTVTDARGPALTLDTGSGDISVAGVSATRVTLETGSGGIRASRVTADEAVLETGSGNVDLELLAQPRQVTVETGSGDVTLRVPEGFGASLDIETGSGGIDLGGLVLRATRLRRHHVVGTVGDGSGRIRIETGSGNVRLTPGA